MKKLFALLLAALMVVSMFAGCSKEDKKSTLVYGSGDYDSINPIMNEHCEIKHLLFDSLVKLDKDGKPVASLAESWTYDDKTLTYTFKLKEGTEWFCPSGIKSEFGEELYNRFSTEKVTARDFVFAMQRAVSPNTNSPSAHRLFIIENAAEIRSGKSPVSSLGVTAPQDYVLVIKLTEPCPDMLERLTESVFMPCNEDFFNEMNGRYGLTHRHILCNGPFYVSAWSKDDSLSIRKNKYYSGSQEVSPSSVNFDFRFDLKTVPGRISSAALSAAMQVSGT